jgi:hypothetical protein
MAETTERRPGTREPESISSTPGWVKLFGIVGTVMIVLFVGLHVAGKSPSGHTPPSAVTEQGLPRP